MEDVLDPYRQPYDPKRPLVCMDETSKKWVAEARVPIPAKPGHPRHLDFDLSYCKTALDFPSSPPGPLPTSSVVA